MENARIIDAFELPYVRKTELKTADLLQSAVLGLLEKTGISLQEIDGLGVTSFTYAPDRAIDLAWQLSISPSWIQDDSNGGIGGLNLLQHALGAIATGQASAIVLVAGDCFDEHSFHKLITEYNSTNRDYLYPIGAANPNLLFSLLTKQYMANHALSKSDFGEIAVLQRQWASLNPKALYQTPLSLQDYLHAKPVSDVLSIFDCVPVAAGANAILLTHQNHPIAQRHSTLNIKAFQARHNYDHQLGSGLQTGLKQLKDTLWHQAQLTPADIDVCSIYDDYPVMVLAQLEDLGFFDEGQARMFIHEQIKTKKIALNTGGGQLSCGQAGTAGGMLGLVEVITQLKNQAESRQIPMPKYGLVSGYGMIEYRYCACSAAVILETT